MRENYAGVWPLTAAAVFALLLSILFKLRLGRKSAPENTKNHKLPPGKRGWPLIGDAFSWYGAVASPHPPRFVQQQALRYGKIFCCSILGKRAVVSVDPSFNRFIVQSEGKLFRSSYPRSFRDLVGKNGVITVHGERHRRLHRIAANLMRVERLSAHFLRDIQLVMLRTLNFPDNHPLLLQDLCRKVAINLMVNQLLGVSSDSDINEMAGLFSDFVDGCLSVAINLPGFAYHTAMKARQSIINKIEHLIKMRRHRQLVDGDGGSGGGVLGRLVDEENLPEDAIADFIINLLFAGNETTAKTMLFAVYYLTHCPKALKHLLEEHESIRSGSKEEEMLTWEDYKGMPFTQCVIDETLRLGGIAIWLMREATEDVKWQDYTIPKGSFVVPFLSAVHLDESLYTNALKFNPWRWLDPENQDKRNWRNGSFFTPFGGGARFCPGAELARLQIVLFLHYFITSYRWTQLKEDRISFYPTARLINGFQICVNSRHNHIKT